MVQHSGDDYLTAAMGSSPPRPQMKRSTPHMLVAALVFLVLLFVAGAAVTVHHKDRRPISPSTSPAAAEKITLSRKMLRDDKRAEAPAASSDGGGRIRSEPLPRGIVQGESNLEMVSMVGDPEHGRQKASRSLLAIPVGIKNKAAVDKLVSKFPAEEFALMLFHYDGAVEQWGDLEWHGRAVHVAAAGQTKWWFAKRFLHPDVVAEYDYVFLWDEDVEVDAFDPARYLAIVRREGLEVSQPALARGSEIHHGITARQTVAGGGGGGDVHRRFYRRARPRCDEGSTAPPCTGWVERMVPVFSRAAWRCTWGMVQNDLVHGWGLDYKLGYCAQGDRTMRVGVVDSEYVMHRGIPSLGGGGGWSASAGRIAVRRRSFAEMQIFNRRWKEAVAADASWADPYPETAAA